LQVSRGVEAVGCASGGQTEAGADVLDLADATARVPTTAPSVTDSLTLSPVLLTDIASNPISSKCSCGS